MEIGPAAFPRGADELRRERHLVEGLVPDLVDLPRIAKARADAVRRAIEEEKAGHPGGMVQRQPLHDERADIVADDAGALDPQRLHERGDIVGQHAGTGLVRPSGVRIAALAEAAEVRRDQPPPSGQPFEHRLPRRPEFRPSVQQQEGRAASGLGDVGLESADIDEAVFDLGHGGYAAAKCSGREE